MSFIPLDIDTQLKCLGNSDQALSHILSSPTFVFGIAEYTNMVGLGHVENLDRKFCKDFLAATSMLPRVRNVSSSSYLCRPLSTKASPSFQSFRRTPLSREDAAIDKTFKSLVKIVSKGDRLGGFAYTKKRNAEKSRLENALAAASNRKGAYAPEKVIFYKGQDNASTLEELSESLQSGPLAEPGSFVELRRWV